MRALERLLLAVNIPASPRKKRLISYLIKISSFVKYSAIYLFLHDLSKIDRHCVDQSKIDISTTEINF